MRIKKEYIGKVIIKGSSRIELREDMTQKEVLYIKNMISPHFVEEVTEEVIEEVIEDKPKRKRTKKDDSNKEE